MSDMELVHGIRESYARDRRDAAEAILRIPLRLHVARPQCLSPQPLTIGVPLPQGTVDDEISTAVETAAGQRTFCQHEILGRWPDGSVKWLLVDFVVRAADSVPLKLLLFRKAETTESDGIDVRQTPAGWRVVAGPNQFELATGREWMLRWTRAGEMSVDQAKVASFTLTDARGRTLRPDISEILPETIGPVRTTFVCRGRFPRCRGLRFECRVCFSSAGGYVRIRPTLHNPNRAGHRGGLWDLGGRGSILFDDFCLHVALPPSNSRMIRFRADQAEPLQTAAGDGVEFYQDSSGGENWQSRNHVNREGRVPCRMPGYRVRSGSCESFGRRAEPLVVARDEREQLEVALPECWQQFPKAVEADSSELRIRLFPTQWDDRFELQGGERKTHTIWLSAMPSDRSDACRLDWAHAPALVTSTGSWYERSGVFDAFPAAETSDHPFLRDLTQVAVSEDGELLARREVIDEYGWRNFGDVWADHEQAYYSGPGPVISHYNNQYDVVEGAIRHLVRSGDPAWWSIADPLARHTMDIDLYHTDADRPEYNHGMFWHTDHYRDAHTATHRTYSRKNASGREYGGGPSAAHVYSTGLLHYFYLTGDRLARDAVIHLADWLIQMEDGRLTELGIIDGGPTGCSSRDERGFHGPGRAAANGVSTLLDAWELTGAGRYLAQAEELIRRVIHPDDDCDSLELLNAERRWSYTMFLLSLCKYLDVKIVADQVDEMYAYGVSCIRQYGRWMLENERPYFDVPEQLEFPTEAWGAQDVRKANAMRRMARFCPEPLSSGLLDRAAATADRGWQDVFRFESRYVARATAILLVEGLRDAYFRGHAEPPAPSAGAIQCPTPAPFQDQRARVRSLLTSPRGTWKLICSLMRPHKWPATLRAVSRRL